MARVTRKRKPDAPPATPLAALLNEHLEALRVRGYSEHTVRNRLVHIRFFLEWCKDRGLAEPTDVTRPVLERYQRHLFHYRKKNGEPLSFRSQHTCLVPLRVWFKWMTRQNYILHNPASEIELPRLGRRLPKHVLTVSEVELVMMQPDLTQPIGLRDRAILEVLYSTGMRRLEVIGLKLYDLDTERGTILIRQGKGKKDRYVPVGERAIAWLQKYAREGRPQIVAEPDDGTVFLTAQGEPFSRDHLTAAVRHHVIAANIGKVGACHLFRHTMATLMHEGGADIRYIQAILGHEDLKTTQIYTQVAIRTLRQVHAATHPGAMLNKETAPSLPTNGTDDPVVKLFAILHTEADEEKE
ncbi:MAG: site-specific tyrosine recombinase XerC [Candidatus Dormibacteraceae bacterium]